MADMVLTLIRQLTDVELLHPAVEQSVSLVLMLIVKLCDPKFNPLTVTEDCPLETAFSCPYESTGASNVIAMLPVPLIAATVKEDIKSRPAPVLRAQPTDVPDIHERQEQMNRSS
jgi:hypothetical protein